ncbi:Cerevisin [Drechslerella dactyloides]|uniref:Cerevisin n=1 Tax=Drechslerella dactyloides TaxID=74499 RepID=A0AAD6NJA7_DREDA|nr:Cerevisin [Drechslerella dactyloides]
MKSLAILSTSLLLSALPSTLAAPTASTELKARWYKPEEHTGPTPSAAAVSVQAADEDPKDDYIVVMAEDETRPWNDIFADLGCNKTNVGKTFGTNIRAFTMSMKNSTGVRMFSMPNVAILEKNVIYRAAVMPTGPSFKPQTMSRELVKDSLRMSRLAKRQSGVFIEQSTAPWGLQRVSSADTVALDGRKDTALTFKYRFDQASGAGVDVYMLDTGINVDQVDFGGRAQMKFSVDGTTTDAQGHGSHTAGTVGSRTFGVAKNVNLIGVKVLQDDGSGSIAGIVQGIDFVISSHRSRSNDPEFKGSVISMSLGGDGLPQSMFNVLQKATSAGIHVSVAAGNENQDACNTSPAGFSQQLPIISVGATDVNDARASFSNFGKCVDIHAPGVDIVSTFNKGPSSTATLQGTSMACPAVSGIIADLLVSNPSLRTDPAGMKKLLLSKALNGVIRAGQNVPSGGQVLLNNGFPGNP